MTCHFEEQTLARMEERLKRYPHAMALRRETVEHPFANLKYRILDNGRFLLRGLRGASTEMALAVLAYNSNGALNLLGPAKLHHELIKQPGVNDRRKLKSERAKTNAPGEPGACLPSKPARFYADWKAALIAVNATASSALHRSAPGFPRLRLRRTPPRAPLRARSVTAYRQSPYPAD